MKTVKVSEVSHSRLLRVVGMLQAAEGKRKTAEDALVFLSTNTTEKPVIPVFVG